MGSIPTRGTINHKKEWKFKRASKKELASFLKKRSVFFFVVFNGTLKGTSSQSFALHFLSCSVISFPNETISDTDFGQFIEQNYLVPL